MKRILGLVLLVLLSFSFFACNQPTSNAEKPFDWTEYDISEFTKNYWTQKYISLNSIARKDWIELPKEKQYPGVSFELFYSNFLRPDSNTVDWGVIDYNHFYDLDNDTIVSWEKAESDADALKIYTLAEEWLGKKLKDGDVIYSIYERNSKTTEE